MQEQTIGGVELHYYALCKRKLWLYYKGIGMEEESDRVLQGKLLHEMAYPRSKRSIKCTNFIWKHIDVSGDFGRII